MNALFGHNETTVRLGLLADDARSALERVASGEENTLEGWLAYGAALNEGRALFHPEDDKGFGQWVADNLLSQVATVEITRDDRSAAMWGASKPDQLETAKSAGNARTLRGMHAKWNELDAERVAIEARAKAEAERRAADEARRKAEADRREAKARADAEAEAIAAVKRAKDDEQRRIAQAQAASAARARAEAEARANGKARP